MSHRHTAVIGLGRMGSAIAERLVASGVPLTLWNRKPAKAQAFDGRAEIAPSASAACAAADVVILRLSDYSAGLEVMDQVAGEIDLQHKTLVQLTGGSSSDARTMHAWARMHALNYLDGAILGYPMSVGTDSAIAFYAGDESVWDACKSTLQLLTGMDRYVGEAIGAAATMACAVLEYYYGATLAMMHGAALCDSERMPLTEYFFSVKAIAPLLAETANNGRNMIAKERYESVDCTLDAHLGALRHIQRMSHDNNIDTRVPDAIIAAYKKAIAAGYGDDQIAAVFETLKRSS